MKIEKKVLFCSLNGEIINDIANKIGNRRQESKPTKYAIYDCKYCQFTQI